MSEGPVRIAAAGDIHRSEGDQERLERAFAGLRAADLVLLVRPGGGRPGRDFWVFELDAGHAGPAPQVERLPEAPAV